MKDVIKKVPVPLCGVMLGTAALGNLLQSYSEGVRYVCGVVAGLLLVLVLLKWILFPKMVKEDLGNPIMASVAGTFPMALMLLSVYVKPFIGQAAFYIWILAILLHVALIIYFTVKFVVKLQMPKVFASYYIVYVGIAVASITAPAYEQLKIGGLLVRLRVSAGTAGSGDHSIRQISQCAGPCQAPDLHLCGTHESMHRRICPVSDAQVRRLFAGNVCRGLRAVRICAGEGHRIFKDAFLPQLCILYVPVCHQRDCFQADDGVPCQFGAAHACAAVCGAGGDDHCRCFRSLCAGSLPEIYLLQK